MPLLVTRLRAVYMFIITQYKWEPAFFITSNALTKLLTSRIGKNEWFNSQVISFTLSSIFFWGVAGAELDTVSPNSVAIPFVIALTTSCLLDWYNFISSRLPMKRVEKASQGVYGVGLGITGDN